MFNFGSRLSDRSRGLILAVSGSTLVSAETPLVRAGDTDAWTFAYIVSLWSALVLGSVSFYTLRSGLLDSLKEFKLLIITSGLLTAISTITIILAVTYTEIANVVVLLATAPFIASLCARLILKEAISRRMVIAILVSFLGVLLVFGNSIGLGSYRGELLSLTAVTSFSLNLTSWRKYPELPRVVVLTTGSIFTFLISISFADPLTPNTRVLLVSLALGVVFSPLARLCSSTSTRYIPVSYVGLCVPVETVLAPIWAWIFFNENVQPSTILGGLIILAAIVFGLTSPRGQVTDSLSA